MATHYTLKEIKTPTINKMNVIENDPGVGGIRLKYLLKDDNGIYQELYFIKPYKKNLANSKEECRKGEWGNTSSPLSNVWYSTSKSYKKLEEIDSLEFRMTLLRVTESVLIGQLNDQSKEFVILSNEDKGKYLGTKRESKPILSFINKFLKF